MEPTIVSASKYGDDSLPGPNGSLSMAEIGRLFKGLSENSTRKSIASILRISEEQLKARKNFTTIPGSLMIFVGLMLLFVPAFIFMPRSTLSRIVPGIAGYGVLLLLALGYAFRHRHSVSRARGQAQRIRALSIEALEAVAKNPEVVSEPLDREQRQFLGKLIKASGRRDEALLALARARES